MAADSTSTASPLFSSPQPINFPVLDLLNRVSGEGGNDEGKVAWITQESPNQTN